MQRLELSGAVRPTYGSLGGKRLKILFMPVYTCINSQCCKFVTRAHARVCVFVCASNQEFENVSAAFRARCE